MWVRKEEGTQDQRGSVSSGSTKHGKWLLAEGLGNVSHGQVENQKEVDCSPYLLLSFGAEV